MVIETCKSMNLSLRIFSGIAIIINTTAKYLGNPPNLFPKTHDQPNGGFVAGPWILFGRGGIRRTKASYQIRSGCGNMEVSKSNLRSPLHRRMRSP